MKQEARYHRLAVEIANQIAEGKYTINDKIRSRSTIASSFQVSAETARKALQVLVESNVIEARAGSGFYVASIEHAQQFVDLYSKTRSIRELRQDMLASILRQKQELEHFDKIIRELEEHTKNTPQELAFSPYKCTVPQGCIHIGKQLQELQIWQRTRATIVAIVHEGDYIVSPGPFARINQHDVLYFVGDFSSKEAMHRLLMEGCTN